LCNFEHEQRPVKFLLCEDGITVPHPCKSTIFYLLGRAVASAGNHRPLSVTDRVRTLHISCGICSGKIGSGSLLH